MFVCEFAFSSVTCLKELTIAQTSLAGVLHYGVFNRSDVIRRGVKYGPFKGKVVNTSEIKTFDDNSYMWEVTLGPLLHFPTLFSPLSPPSLSLTSGSKSHSELQGSPPYFRLTSRRPSTDSDTSVWHVMWKQH